MARIRPGALSEAHIHTRVELAVSQIPSGRIVPLAAGHAIQEPSRGARVDSHTSPRQRQALRGG